MKEIEEYRHFCKKREAEKALNTLKGILLGIKIDNKINQSELEELLNWISLQKCYEAYPPFSELIPIVESSVSDMYISKDEFEDILWVCDNYLSKNELSDAITQYIQIMQGIFHGILADGELNNDEITNAFHLMQKYSCLEGTYPYDEIYALIAHIISDGVITEDERSMLQGFLTNFIDTTSSINIHETDCKKIQETYHIDGICAYNPQIIIENKLFCFTGKSNSYTRNEIKDIIISNGGNFNNNITKKTDYLVVGDAGNPCWMYACYGRKVEQAVSLRKSGNEIKIVKECDFLKTIRI